MHFHHYPIESQGPLSEVRRNNGCSCPILSFKWQLFGLCHNQFLNHITIKFPFHFCPKVPLRQNKGIGADCGPNKFKERVVLFFFDVSYSSFRISFRWLGILIGGLSIISYSSLRGNIKISGSLNFPWPTFEFCPILLQNSMSLE